MLLVSRCELVEENAFKVFHHYGVHLSACLLMQIFSWLAGLCYYGDDMKEYRRPCNIIEEILLLKCSITMVFTCPLAC